MRRLSLLCLAACLVPAAPSTLPGQEPAGRPMLVGHRGLITEAPENTIAGFSACLELRVGFEVDVRRSRDGQLVCVHDETLTRTTSGQGRVNELTLGALKKLDAGFWFDRAYAGERIPTLGEVIGLARTKLPEPGLVALDLKVFDVNLPSQLADISRTADFNTRLLCIGLPLREPAMRQLLRQSLPTIGIAVVAETAEDLPDALDDPYSNWVYVRFVPTAEQVLLIHQPSETRPGKKVFLSGPAVAGREPENWRLAREAGVDALLTDYPLECRRSWKDAPKSSKDVSKQ